MKYDICSLSQQHIYIYTHTDSTEKRLDVRKYVGQDGFSVCFLNTKHQKMLFFIVIYMHAKFNIVY